MFEVERRDVLIASAALAAASLAAARPAEAGDPSFMNNVPDGFNSGAYETIDLSQWIAGNPADVLATNLSRHQDLFAEFPHRDVFIAP
jgi:hypothetical protein